MAFQFHRSLVSFAILVNFCLSLWSVRQWRITQDASDLVVAAGLSAVSGGLLLFLFRMHNNLMAMHTSAVGRQASMDKV